MFGDRIAVLDHGYVQLVETWGSDERIVEAARMSTGKGFLGWGPTCKACGSADRTPLAEGTMRIAAPLAAGQTKHYVAGEQCADCGEVEVKPGDEKLLRYLYENRHDTPFEMAGMTVEVQAPLFVFREWHRHRVPWSYNEASARYAPLPTLDYVPTTERLMRGGGHLTKQAASAGGVLTEENAHEFLNRLVDVQDRAESLYRWALRNGVPKELARLSMTTGRYSKMRASANARGWLHLFGLRLAPNAQWEFQEYARACARIFTSVLPRTWGLFAEGHAPLVAGV